MTLICTQLIRNENAHASILYTPNISNSKTLKKQLDPLLSDMKRHAILPFSPSLLQKTIQNTFIKPAIRQTKFGNYERIIQYCCYIDQYIA
jgi:hypothetical protein